MLKPSKVRKILLISLTNIGDVILTFPVLDILKSNFPNAEISMVVGPKAESLVAINPHLKNVFIYNKRQTRKEALCWLSDLRRYKFDTVIDLRNSAIPVFLWPCQHTSFIQKKVPNIHMTQKHLNRLHRVFPFEDVKDLDKFGIPLDENITAHVLEALQMNRDQKYCVIVPGAANEDKRWNEKKFVEVADQLSEKYQVSIVLVGSQEDRVIADRISELMKGQSINACGRLTLLEVGALMKNSQMVLSNDTGPMHLASYLNVPVLALFGFTDSVKYGPWSTVSGCLRGSDFVSSSSGESSSDHGSIIDAIQPEHVMNKIVYHNEKFSFTNA